MISDFDSVSILKQFLDFKAEDVYRNDECAYQIYNKKTGEVLFIGAEPTCDMEERITYHLTKRNIAILNKVTMLDSFLATLAVEDIGFKTFPCDKGTANETAKMLNSVVNPPSYLGV